jgi:hypothetical protein
MKAQKEHRQSLLNKLKEAEEAKASASNLFEHAEEEDDKGLAAFAEIDMWLAQKAIELIQKAIIDNELDDF